jgi:hypothetical protein
MAWPISSKVNPACRHDRMTVKGITYIQYRCPLYYGPRQELLFSPANQAKFSQQKGCNYLWRLTVEQICVAYATRIWQAAERQESQRRSARCSSRAAGPMAGLAVCP